MCKKLSVIYCKVLGIFPILEAARPRSTSGIQALCSLHVALEKAKNILQHCCSCSKLYLVCFLPCIFSIFSNFLFAIQLSYCTIKGQDYTKLVSFSYWSELVLLMIYLIFSSVPTYCLYPSHPFMSNPCLMSILASFLCTKSFLFRGLRA